MSMRATALKLVTPTDVIPVPWYRRRWARITGKVAWWLLTFTVELAWVCLCMLFILAGALFAALGVMSHFAGGDR
jgi:hypothetical protein